MRCLSAGVGSFCGETGAATVMWSSRQLLSSATVLGARTHSVCHHLCRIPMDSSVEWPGFWPAIAGSGVALFHTRSRTPVCFVAVGDGQRRGPWTSGECSGCAGDFIARPIGSAIAAGDRPPKCTDDSGVAHEFLQLNVPTAWCGPGSARRPCGIAGSTIALELLCTIDFTGYVFPRRRLMLAVQCCFWSAPGRAGRRKRRDCGWRRCGRSVASSG
jgi:hypothetical protein